MIEIQDALEVIFDDLRRMLANSSSTPESRACAAVISIASLLLDLVADARAAGAASMRDRAKWACCCRCRSHERIGCPICLAVEGCPEHATPDERALRPDDLLDPTVIASEWWTATQETTWERAADQRAVWIDAARRIVVARAARRG